MYMEKKEKDHSDKFKSKIYFLNVHTGYHLVFGAISKEDFEISGSRNQRLEAKIRGPENKNFSFPAEVINGVNSALFL